MLARLQQVLAAAALLLAVWLAWAGACWAGWPGALLGAACVPLMYAGVLALEFAWMHRLNRDDPAPRATLAEMVRAWWGEVLSGPRVFGWRQPFRSWRWPDHLPDEAAGRRGVLFIHGYVCNRGLWAPWQVALTQRQVPWLALNLEPVFGSIDRYVPLVEDAVARLNAATGLAPIVVAHSMGGLATRRWWAADGHGDRVHHVITLGTPHHGTWLARFALSANAREMRLGSAWLQRLARAEPADLGRRFTCFYGHCDNIAFPASTATLPGADNRHLRGVAHVHMADHPAPLQALLERLGA